MIQSYRASEPPADKPKQEEDLQIPHSSGEVSHGGENKKAGEEIISLSTLIERLEKGLVLKTYTLTLLFSEFASHDSLWRIICIGSPKSEPMYILTFPVERFD